MCAANVNKKKVIITRVESKDVAGDNFYTYYTHARITYAYTSIHVHIKHVKKTRKEDTYTHTPVTKSQLHPAHVATRA